MSLVFFILFSAAVKVFAVPPATPYNPGETLDPSCAVGSANCFVQILPDQTGHAGEFLTTDGTMTSWGSVAGLGIGNSVTSGTVGSVLFVDPSGDLGQDNANFFWDDATNRLGIGDSTPAASLTVGSGDFFQVNSLGAIAAATGIASSGTITFSGLTASKAIFTDGSKNLTSTGTLGADQGGTGLTSYGTTNQMLGMNSAGTALEYKTFATGTSGTDFSINHGAGTITFNIPNASTSNRGLLTAADWTTFNNKLSTTRAINTTGPLTGGGDLSADRTIGLGGLTGFGSANQILGMNNTATGYEYKTVSVNAVAVSNDVGVTFSSANALVINLPTASATVRGVLSNSDWTLFNNKVSAVRTINTTGPLTGGGDLSADRTIGLAGLTGLGTANQILGMNSAGTAYEYKTFATGTTGTDFGIAHSANTITFNIPNASASNRGFLTSSDWTVFNNKLTSTLTSGNIFVGNASNIATGVVLTLSATPGTFVLSNTGVLTMSNADGTTRGLLSAADWTTFNNKISSTRAINTTSPLTGGGDLSADRTIGLGGLTGFGSANQILGMNNTATGYEYKTVSVNPVAVANDVGVTLTTPNALVINLPTASATVRGVLSNSDWAMFNAKENALTFSTGLTRTTNTIIANLSTGISGGQSVIGGTGAGENLTLSSTGNATKGNILFGSSVYDEANNMLGLGLTSSLGARLHVVGSGSTSSTFAALFHNSSGTSNSLAIRNDGSVGIGSATFDATNPEKLLVAAGTTTSVNAISATGTINSYLQMNIQNMSSGTAASSDIVATANNGNETSGYIDMGINSSGYTGGVFGSANDAYLYNIGAGTGGNLLIGTGSAGKQLLFLTGGTSQSTNERMRLTDTGLGIGTTNPLAKFHISEIATTAVRGVLNSQYSTSIDGARLLFRKARGTLASPVVVTSGDVLGDLVFEGYDGSNYLQMGSIQVSATGTVASTRVPTQMTFSTATDVAPSVLTTAMTIDSAQKIGIGTTTPSSKLDITTDSLGATQTQTSGLALVNTTAATSILNQNSPAIRWKGSGWKTNATAASQSVEFRVHIEPETGAASPTSKWRLMSSINGGTYTNGINVDSRGYITVGGSGNVQYGGTSTGTSYDINGPSALYIANVASNTNFYGHYVGLVSNTTSASGTNGVFKITNTFAPTSGTGVYNFLALEPTINQTGGANGITRGLYINPTITAASDFRALDIAAGRIVATVGTQTGLQNAFFLSSTLPSTGDVQGARFFVTSSGSGAANTAMQVNLLGGYSGSGVTIAITGENLAAGTGNNLNVSSAVTNVLGNAGMSFFAYGTTTGLNVGMKGEAANGNLNIGSYSKAVSTKNNATNIGAFAAAINAGTTPTVVGGWFSLATNTPTWENAALVADNGAIAAPIFLGKDGGTTVFTLNDEGNIALIPNNSAITSGTLNRIALTSTFAPTSGTGVMNGLILSQTVNQTGGANGITRGLYINPIITAAADWRAIETSSGRIVFNSDIASAYNTTIFNDGNNDNRFGLLIQAGADTPSAGKWIQFQDGDGTDVGSICYTGGQANVCAPSDIRLKQNITDTMLSLDTLNKINVKDFSYISDPSHRTIHGFIAQELNEVYPDAVSVPSDPSEYWKVSYSQLTPLLVKSVQELDVKVGNLASLDLTRPTSVGSLILQFLADTGNGIQQIFTRKITTHELCVDDVCVTRDQFRQMIQNSGMQSSGSSTPAPQPEQSTSEGSDDNASETVEGSENGLSEDISEAPLDTPGTTVETPDEAQAEAPIPAE